MKRLLMITMTLCSLLYAAEEPVSVTLSGTVKDGDGEPLEGVTVTLAQMDSLSAETGADGAFTLTNVTGVLTPENRKASFGFTFRNNAVVFTSLSKKVSGTMALYSGDGRLITSVSLDRLHTGQQRVTLPELSSGIYLLAGTVGGESFTRSLVCIGNDLYMKNKTTEAGGNGSFTLKKTAAAAVSDTIIASKEGYDTAMLPIDSYTMEDIEIELTEEGQGGEFTITSTSFSDGDEMPDEYTCEGKAMGDEISPQFAWSGAPEGTKSFAMVFKDMTIVESSPSMAYHWAMWNIPASVTEMPEGLSGDQFPSEMGGAEQKSAMGGMGGSNEFLGPCPDYTHTGATHDYSLTLYAFDQEEISPTSTGVQQLDQWFEQNAIDKTEITATSDAEPQ